MITVVTPFSRLENLELMANHLKGKCNWVVLIDDLNLMGKFPEWVRVIHSVFKKRPDFVSNFLFNNFIDLGLKNETQYMILCDDDFTSEGFFDKIPDEDVVVVSMDRGLDVLRARPEMMKIGRVGGEQVIVKGKILKNYRYGLSAVGDGEMIEKMVKNCEKFTYVPDAYVMFNWLEDGRHLGFKRKPIVLFVGDYYCAANPAMGISEWETNIWKSLESTELADVARFHMDKYYYHFGKRGDEALLERVKEIRPDWVVLVNYKPLGSDSTVISKETFLRISNISNCHLVTIWGDLEAIEQLALAHEMAHCCWKVIGTANKSVVETNGFTYMHVPKDPNVFNNPNKERDIDVVFSGSYGRGREERREVLQYLIDNGVNLVLGGSEGGDHFTTEEYADRYKRAKIAISFSQARGMNVVNARPFEVMSCGAMLLEQKSPELAKLYEEGIDYDVWTTKEDLLEKVRYYLGNDDARKRIADTGYARTSKLYTAKVFWEEALKR